MVVGFVLIMGTLGIGLRIARRSARAGAAAAAAITNGANPLASRIPHRSRRR